MEGSVNVRQTDSKYGRKLLQLSLEGIETSPTALNISKDAMYTPTNDNGNIFQCMKLGNRHVQVINWLIKDYIEPLYAVLKKIDPYNTYSIQIIFPMKRMYLFHQVIGFNDHVQSI